MAFTIAISKDRIPLKNNTLKQKIMNLEYQLNLSPTLSDLQEIEKWLIEEKKASGNGFYCNWNIIKKAFKNKKFIALNQNDLSVGFLILLAVKLLNHHQNPKASVLTRNFQLETNVFSHFHPHKFQSNVANYAKVLLSHKVH